MKYTITYQERQSPDGRPIEDGRDIHIDANDNNGFALIPNIGDFVHMIPMGADAPGFEGKVTGKLFRYYLAANGEHGCHVNIIVDSSEDVPDLIKE